MTKKNKAPGDDERKKSPAMTKKNKVPGDDEKKRIFIREETENE